MYLFRRFLNFFLNVYYRMNYIYNYFENANLILPKTESHGSLWLGNYKSALDEDFLIDNDISVITNCSVDLPYIFDVIDSDILKIRKLETFRIAVYDSLLDHDIYLMEKYFHVILPILIKKLFKEKKNILIHCYAGKQRSAILVTALLYILVSEKKLSKKEQSLICKDKCKIDEKKCIMNCVIQYILKNRSQVFTYGFRINFKQALEKYFNFTL